MMRQCSALIFAFGLLMPAAAFAQTGVPDGGSQGPQATLAGSCVAGKLYFASTPDSTSTTSTTHVDVPTMTITFKIGGTVPSCLAADFSAMTFAAATDALLMVRALLDGVEIFPGEVQFSGDDDEDVDGKWSRSHNHQWVANVAPGIHTLKIQFRSFFAGDTVHLHRKTLTLRTK